MAHTYLKYHFSFFLSVRIHGSRGLSFTTRPSFCAAPFPNLLKAWSLFLSEKSLSMGRPPLLRQIKAKVCFNKIIFTLPIRIFLFFLSQSNLPNNHIVLRKEISVRLIYVLLLSVVKV